MDLEINFLDEINLLIFELSISRYLVKINFILIYKFIRIYYLLYICHLGPIQLATICFKLKLNNLLYVNKDGINL
jgi:hypothetical protein